ncbi:TldD-like protein [archaeon]|nr:TldD-like protein [archaeon]
MEDLAKFAVDYALKKGAKYAETRLENTTSNGIVLKNGNLEASSFSTYEGLGMRFIVQGKLGFVSTNELDKKARLKRLITDSIKKTKSSKKYGEKVGLADDVAHKDKYEVKQKKNLLDVDISEKIKWLMESERAIKDSKVNVPGRFVAYSDNLTTEHLVNSDGTEITAVVPKANFYYLLTIAENNKVTQRYSGNGGCGGWEVCEGWNVYDTFKEEVTSMKTNLVKGKKSPKGVMPIVCGPEVVGIMVHESSGHPYEADRILGREAAQAGESFITKNMVGYKIGSDKVTVVDDPTMENSYGYYKYDNEGVKGKKKYLQKDGVITEFLHNRETAFHMGLISNGSSRATDYDKESIVRMSNTYMLPGKVKEEELFEGIKKGVFVKNFMEWNIDDKRLNQKYTGAEAYLIENGEIKSPIINPIIEVSTTKLYHAVDEVANNLELFAGNCGKGEPMQGIPVFMGGPSIRLQGLRIK